MPNTPFSEQDYYAAYKQIRNAFRKFDDESLIGLLLGFVNRSTRNSIDELQKHPWAILLLVKWILLDYSGKAPRRPLANADNATVFINKMIDLAAKTRLPSEFDHPLLFFRRIAFQQFLYQHQFSNNNFARQFLLFVDVADNHGFRSEFKRITGLDTEQFLIFSLVTVVRFLEANRVDLPEIWFTELTKRFGNENVDKFLRIISQPLPIIAQRLKASDKGRRLSSEYYELTPFIEFPLVRTQSGRMLSSYRGIIFRSLEHYIYDTLRRSDAQKFMTAFGHTFENYVERAIKYSGLKYIRESEINKKLRLQENNQIIDFIITDGEANIYVDAKAVEMNHQGKVTNDSDILKDKTDGSILKAISQAYSTLKAVHKYKGDENLRHKEKNYLIVVTYKELYLGTGRWYYEMAAKEKIDSLRTSQGNAPVIDLDDIYFLTIEEFEYIAEAIHQGKMGLAEIIEKAKTLDSDPRTRKFNFMLHIATWEFNPAPPRYLVERTTGELDKIAALLQSGTTIAPID